MQHQRYSHIVIRRRRVMRIESEVRDRDSNPCKKLIQQKDENKSPSSTEENAEKRKGKRKWRPGNLVCQQTYAKTGPESLGVEMLPVAVRPGGKRT